MIKRYYVTIISRYLYEKYQETFRYILEAKDEKEIEKNANDLLKVLKRNNVLQDFEILNIEMVG